MKLNFLLNGKHVAADVNTRSRLLSVLREKFNLINVKKDCGAGYCGHCTILLDREPVRSCLIPAITANDRSVQTIKGLEADDEFQAIISAYRQFNMPCKFCYSGKTIALYSLIQENSFPSEEQIVEIYESHKCYCVHLTQFLQIAHTAARMAERRVRGLN